MAAALCLTMVGALASGQLASLQTSLNPEDMQFSVENLQKDTAQIADGITIPEQLAGYDFQKGCVQYTDKLDDDGNRLDSYPSLAADYGTSINGDGTVLTLSLIHISSMGYYVFQDCDNLTSVTLLDGVTDIGNGVFADCDSLTSVTIPGSVTDMGGAFMYCHSLTSVTILDGVTSIGESAFAACVNLTSVTIPDSVTSIGTIAFRACESLTSVTIPDSVTSIGPSAFEDLSLIHI